MLFNFQLAEGVEIDQIFCFFKYAKSLLWRAKVASQKNLLLLFQEASGFGCQTLFYSCEKSFCRLLNDSQKYNFMKIPAHK